MNKCKGLNNNPCVKTPQDDIVKESQIIEQTCMLDGHLEELEKHLEELENRLKPVIREEEKEELSFGGRDSLVPLAETLCNLNGRARTIFENLTSIIYRLEI